MKDPKKLLKYAIDYLSKFSSSKANLERILKKKIQRLKIEKQDKFLLYNSINEIINKLEKNNFIDDYNYTYTKIRNFNFQGKSKIFIKSYLIQKGVKSEIIASALEDYKNENLNWEYESAKNFARKKRLSSNDEFKEKSLSKMARAGFSYDLSKKILEDI